MGDAEPDDAELDHAELDDAERAITELPCPEPGEPGEVVGRLVAVHRYPLKSAAGEHLDAVRVLATGLQHDRRWSVTRPDGEPVTGKQAPRLAEVTARVVDGSLEVLGASLDEVVGPHRLADAPAGNQQVAPVHLVSDRAEAADDAPDGCDPFPRANLVLDLPVPGAERAWAGRGLRVGGVRLRVTRLPRRCLGVYAEVLTPGTVRVGDEVVLLPPIASGPLAGA